MTDQLAELRALTARLGPSQALRAIRRPGTGYETMTRRSAGIAADTEMLARHRHITERRAVSDDPALALRRRQLELLRLAAR